MIARCLLFLTLYFLLLTTGCTQAADVCAPQDDRIGFFSQGDCVFMRAPFFRGHEWLTYFGNEQLDEGGRFSSSQVQWMALGNRRVDYPKELLVHLDNGVVSYINALQAHTDRASVQREHFLLDDRNSESEAAVDAIEHVRSLTREGLELWGERRTRALTLFGQAQHTIQDSFSPAHTVRVSQSPLFGATRAEAQELLPDGGLDAGVAPCSGSCSCIKRVKAYMPRARGRRDGVLFHGGGNENVGHLTTQDSIYRSGRDCHRPNDAADVWNCLDPYARQGVQGTAAYLVLVRELIQAKAVGLGLDRMHLNQKFDAFASAHLSLCDDS